MSENFTPYKTSAWLGGEQRHFRFDNGYGASVIRNPRSYGGDKDLFELAVLDAQGHLTYDTPVTDDVIGWLSEAEVQDTLAQIAALPAVES